ncbi:hypothetical protein KIN20_027011 [Parelaphostrongylus tenuis]|uniref:Tubulin--tyrosine ligase-like protein 5 n=1 Tax=Parelaphostrongylus tenuis TaxID=148309 RepID=A0AAD5QYU1_PARTN|nr:hypothetical protein KIN20_027011 [Parelaphostrongylus tenuis]
MKADVLVREVHCDEGTDKTDYAHICEDYGACYINNENKKRIEYLTFTPDSLNHISRNTAANVRERYTQTGEDFNLAFKMINSDTKLVKTVLHSHGFTQCSRKNPSFNLLWCGSAIRATHMRSIQPWQRLNQFPRSTELTRKDKLYDNIRRSSSIFGNVFSFIPDFFRDSTSSRGKGIFFANKLREIPPNDTLLVSRYVDNPLLINGHKVASEKYCSDDDSRNAFVHLTNYSINKNNSNFVRNESMASEDYGHKWTLGALLRHLEKDGVDSKLLMLRIEDIVIKSLLSVQTRITSACRTTTPYIGTNFELFGFDILVDAELKPWLLEVNLSPSLTCDAPLDSLVKTRLICDLFNLACVPLVNRKFASIDSFQSCKESGNDSNDLNMFSDANKKIFGHSKRGYATKRKRVFHNPFTTSPNGLDAIMRVIYHRARMELSRKGGFVRIFPREHSYPLYRGIMERIGSDRRDENLYTKEYGLDSRFSEIQLKEERLAPLYHEVIMDSSLYPSIESVPPKLAEIMKAWHNSANAYTQKITKAGETYAARLPVVRPSARLRTKSCSEWYEVKKATLAEARMKLRHQQEASKIDGPGRPENKENSHPSVAPTS